MSDEKKQYMEASMLIFKEEGLTQQQLDSFVNELIELVEKYGAITASGFSLLTEEELQDMEFVVETDLSDDEDEDEEVEDWDFGDDDDGTGFKQ